MKMFIFLLFNLYKIKPYNKIIFTNKTNFNKTNFTSINNINFLIFD